MPIDSGTTLSFYEILGPLGAGGMGEVYRAMDTRLEREVAIKVLPEELADDEDRLRRFEREAKTLASLNHPNVAQVFGIDQVDDTCFIAMELVGGEDLSERLAQGALPIDEAVEVARQIAGGLEAAHEAGVVHRDLKPANVRITPERVVKVLDFGLAKPTGPRLTPASGTSVTARPDSFLMTEEGIMLGTPTYMSPEQARAQPVDRRTDIWAFGCVLFECLTGKRAFDGETLGDVIAAVIAEEPDLSLLPAATPASIRALLARCLEKDARGRLRDIGEARVVLERHGDGEAGTPVTARPGASSPSRGLPAWAALGGMALAALAGAFGVYATLDSEPAEPTLSEPAAVRTLTYSGDDGMPAASPDGRLIAFRSGRDGRDRIWLKQLDTGGEQALTEGIDSSPRFSPDGNNVLFLRSENGGLSVYRKALVGGDARKIVDNAMEACWSPDGTRIAILRLYTQGDRSHVALVEVDLRTREERELARTDQWMYSARWSPGGGAISVVTAPQLGQTTNQAQLLVVPVEGGEASRHPIPGALIDSQCWAGDMRVVYSQNLSSAGDLGDPLARVVLWDLETDRRQTLFYTESLFTSLGTNAVNRGTGLTVVEDETLAFDKTTVRQLLWEQEIVDGFASKPGRNLLPGEARDRQPIYSPDGNRLRFSSNRSGNLDLWEIDLETGDLRQLTDDRAQDWDPAFAPDGEGLLWSSDRSGAFEVWAASSDVIDARQLTQDGVDAENPVTSLGGEWIVYWSSNPAGDGVWRIRPDGSDAELMVEGDYVQSSVSDDGRYAAFLKPEAQNLRSRLRVVEIETGRLLPFEIVVSSGMTLNETVLLGRTRWISNNALSEGPALAFLGVDEEGRSGVYLQDFDPEEDTTATRRPIAGFDEHLLTESFDISPDGSRITLALLEVRRRLMLAEGLTGVSAPEFAD
jgi:Tol biopolymer transport system component